MIQFYIINYSSQVAQVTPELRASYFTKCCQLGDLDVIEAKKKGHEIKRTGNVSWGETQQFRLSTLPR